MARTIAVDFDGVLHAYTSGWQGQLNICDPPVPGALPWLARMVERFDVIIFSARLNPRGLPQAEVLEAFRDWFRRHGLPERAIEALQFWTKPGKPMAILYIDDRGWRFEGRFPDAEEILALEPWTADQRESSS